MHCAGVKNNAAAAAALGQNQSAEQENKIEDRSMEVRGSWPLSSMQLSLLLLLSLHCAFLWTTTSAQGLVIRIDCGGFSNFTDQYNETWIQDEHFTGGSAASVSYPSNFSQAVEQTIRYFPTTGGKEHCYVVPVPNGRYLVRYFFVYDNYDSKEQAPNFDVSVEDTVVFSWRFPWPGVTANVGAYSDLHAFVQDENVLTCFYSYSTDAPVIGALEIVQVDPLSYASTSTGQDVVLVNYGRLTAGNTSLGAGLTNDSDIGGRAWEVDSTYSPTAKLLITTSETITGSNVAPNYFPMRLYQLARSVQVQPHSVIDYSFSVDSSSDYMIWFHLAEIDPNISAPGQRVFSIAVNGIVVFPNVDIFKAVGNYAAYDLNCTVKNLTETSLHLSLTSSVGVPVVSGVEVLAILPEEIGTDPTELMAMQDLKNSLQVPERMGWNGDPCAPSTWDTWNGVTCSQNSNGKALEITRLDLSDQGLAGTIPDSITTLSALVYLNLSNNQITGTIPSGLGGGLLESVDLSTNILTGTIPESLGSPELSKVLLNENELSGQVPESLYSLGVEGGFINLSLNKGLCGIPSLPSCPGFWGKGGGLSGGAKWGIAFATLAALALAGGAVWLYIRKRNSQEDYNFGLPHQLAMRHKRYMQYRATLQSNSEDTHMMRVSPSKYGFSTTMNTL